MRRKSRKTICSNQISSIKDCQRQNPELQDIIQGIKTQTLHQRAHFQTWQSQYLRLKQQEKQNHNKLATLVRAYYLREDLKQRDTNIENNLKLKGWQPFICLSKSELQKVITYQQKIVAQILSRQVPVELSQYILCLMKESPFRRKSQDEKQKIGSQKYKSIIDSETRATQLLKKSSLTIISKQSQFS